MIASMELPRAIRYATLKTWLFWAVFLSVHLGLFIYGFVKQKDDPELYLLNQIGGSVYISRGAGLVLGLDCALILLPMCRNLLVLLRSTLPVTSKFVSFDDNIFLHKMTAFSMLFFTLLHVNGHYLNFLRVEQRLPQLGMKAWNVHYSTWAGMTGHMMLLVIFLLYTATALKVRKSKFELFWYVTVIF
jgi:NADPH oxidase